MSGQPPPPYVAPPPPKSHAAAVIAVVVVVLVVGIAAVVGLGIIARSGPGGSNPLSPTTVTVTEINWQVSGCGFTSSTSAGFTLSGGQSQALSASFYYPGIFGLGSCYIDSVSIQTPGFSLVSDNAPFNIPGGTTGTLTLVVGAPNANYDGPLDLSVTAS